jgi:hypothetical protein
MPKTSLKKLAGLKVQYARRVGKIGPPNFCPKCGTPVNRIKRFEAHHHDYSKPLEVIYLCSRCHHAEHPEMFGHKMDICPRCGGITEKRWEECIECKKSQLPGGLGYSQKAKFETNEWHVP